MTPDEMFTVKRQELGCEPFQDGEWTPIDIHVLNERFFNLVKKLAEEYSAITAKSVRIIKEF
jgi:hypothetical protein